jgi:hypothetical protein
MLLYTLNWTHSLFCIIGYSQLLNSGVRCYIAKIVYYEIVIKKCMSIVKSFDRYGI